MKFHLIHFLEQRVEVFAIISYMCNAVLLISEVNFIIIHYHLFQFTTMYFQLLQKIRPITVMTGQLSFIPLTNHLSFPSLEQYLGLYGVICISRVEVHKS